MSKITPKRPPVKPVIEFSPTPPGTPILVSITMGKLLTNYWCELIPGVSHGIGVRFRKLGDVGEVYDVWIEDNHRSCHCQGHLRWGHCKHVAAVLLMLERGLLKPSPRPEQAHEIPARKKTVWCEHCQDAPGVYCEYCSF